MCQVSCIITFHLQLHGPARQAQLVSRSKSPQARTSGICGHRIGEVLKHYVAVEIICPLQTTGKRCLLYQTYPRSSSLISTRFQQQKKKVREHKNISEYKNIARDQQIFESPLQNSYTPLLPVCFLRSKYINLLFI